ncbi:MAG: SDR family NAD(P)-dependent oxidoreductase [Actinomycetes bacterium]
MALQNAHASSKRWVRQFTETLRLETKGSGVRVHGLNPGLVTTDLLGQVACQPGYQPSWRPCRRPPGAAVVPLIRLPQANTARLWTPDRRPTRLSTTAGHARTGAGTVPRARDADGCICWGFTVMPASRH